MRQVAALYVDPLGHYPRIPAVDAWDQARDAKLYEGPHPVVAHPPCGPWGVFAWRCKKDDPSCGPRAVAQVRAYGGVLEHPRASRLFSHCALPRPGAPPDAWGGYTIEVNQVDWGHVARKPTWLYMVGVPPALLVYPEPRAPTHWCAGTHRPGQRGTTPPGIKVCSAEQRRRTPQAFAAWLIALARAVP
jgi:hypothetical protein